MNPELNPDKKRIFYALIIGTFLIILSAALYAVAVFMVSMLVFACRESLPDWLYATIFAGFPVPLIYVSIVIPYLYYIRKSWTYLMFNAGAGLFMSGLIFLIWFLILTKYC